MFTIFTMLCLSLLSCSKPSGVLKVDATNKDIAPVANSITYKGLPFTGMLIERYESGKLKKQTHYEAGLLEGLSEGWFENGQKESERYYEAGEKEGVHKGWWPNGNARFEYAFSEGNYHGLFKEWYESGERLHVFEYNRGKEVRAIGWRLNGRTYINFAVHNGRKYGLTNSRLCYSLKDELGVFNTKK